MMSLWKAHLGKAALVVCALALAACSPPWPQVSVSGDPGPYPEDPEQAIRDWSIGYIKNYREETEIVIRGARRELPELYALDYEAKEVWAVCTVFTNRDWSNPGVPLWSSFLTFYLHQGKVLEAKRGFCLGEDQRRLIQ